MKSFLTKYSNKNIISYILLGLFSLISMYMLIFKMDYNGDYFLYTSLYFDIFEGDGNIVDWTLQNGRLIDFSAVLFGLFYKVLSNLYLSLYLVCIVEFALFVAGIVILIRILQLQKAALYIFLFFAIQLHFIATGFIIEQQIFDMYDGAYTFAIIFGIYLMVGIFYYLKINISTLKNILLLTTISLLNIIAVFNNKIYVIWFCIPLLGFLCILIYRKYFYSDEFLFKTSYKKLFVAIAALLVTTAISLLIITIIRKYNILIVPSDAPANNAYFYDLSNTISRIVIIKEQFDLRDLYLAIECLAILLAYLLSIPVLLTLVFKKNLEHNSKYYLLFFILISIPPILFAIISRYYVGIYNLGAFVRYHCIVYFYGYFIISIYLSKFKKDHFVPFITLVLIFLSLLFFKTDRYSIYKTNMSHVFKTNNPYNHNATARCLMENKEKYNLHQGLACTFDSTEINTPLLALGEKGIYTYPSGDLFNCTEYRISRWLMNVKKHLKEGNNFNFAVSIDPKFNNTYSKPIRSFTCPNNQVVYVYGDEFNARLKRMNSEMEFLFKNYAEKNSTVFDTEKFISFSGYSHHIDIDRGFLFGPADYGYFHLQGLKASKGKYKMTIEYIFHGANIQDVKWGVQLAKQNTAPWWVMKPSNLPSKKGKLEKEFVLEEDNMYMNYIFVLENETKNNPSLMEIRGVVIEKM